MSDPRCPNLWRLYGDRFKVSFDECYTPGSTPWENRDRWAMTIRCRFGVIVPWGDALLGVMIDRHPFKAAEVMNIPGSKLVQSGDNELTITFPVERFEQVAAIVLPYKRRQYTAEEREIIGKRLAPHQIRYESKSDSNEPKTHGKAKAVQ